MILQFSILDRSRFWSSLCAERSGTLRQRQRRWLVLEPRPLPFRADECALYSLLVFSHVPFESGWSFCGVGHLWLGARQLALWPENHTPKDSQVCARALSHEHTISYGPEKRILAFERIDGPSFRLALFGGMTPKVFVDHTTSYSDLRSKCTIHSNSQHLIPSSSPLRCRYLSERYPKYQKCVGGRSCVGNVQVLYSLLGSAKLLPASSGGQAAAHLPLTRRGVCITYP